MTDEQYQVLHVPAQHALLRGPGPLCAGAGEEKSLPGAQRQPAHHQAPVTDQGREREYKIPVIYL